MSEETTSKVNNTKKLLYQLIDPNLLDANGVIREDKKFQITMPEFNIYNSTVKGKPEDKFETVLFLPKGEGRKGEGGMRTRGYFKHSYKLNAEDNLWYICDLEGKLVKPVPQQIEQNIKEYLSTLPDSQDYKELPLISVVTVVLNGEKYLEQTIQNVITQTYLNVEYIIIDGDSTDGTLDIIKKYEHVIDYWVSERDKGIYDAMNKGIQLSLGKWLNFMNAGDTFCKKEILSEIFLCNEYKDCQVIYGDVIIVFDNFNIYKKSEKIEKIKYKIPFSHQSSFFSSDLIKKYMFDRRFKIAGDYELLLRLYLTGFRFCYTNSFITYFKPFGISAREGVLAMKEAYIAKKLNNICTIENKIYSVMCILIEILKLIGNYVLPEKFIEIYRKIRYKTKL